MVENSVNSEKRGRGRPKKTENTLKVEQLAVKPAEKAPKPGKQVGRPKKTSAPGQKRPVGRPKKAK